MPPLKIDVPDAPTFEADPAIWAPVAAKVAEYREVEKKRAEAVSLVATLEATERAILARSGDSPELQAEAVVAAQVKTAKARALGLVYGHRLQVLAGEAHELTETCARKLIEAGSIYGQKRAEHINTVDLVLHQVEKIRDSARWPIGEVMDPKRFISTAVGGLPPKPPAPRAPDPPSTEGPWVRTHPEPVKHERPAEKKPEARWYGPVPFDAPPVPFDAPVKTPTL
jgi:hypothetical protein